MKSFRKNALLTLSFCLLLLSTSFSSFSSLSIAQDEAGNWQSWRGPNANGITENQTPPTEWTGEKNVIWKTAVPGRGHASPTVIGNKILLATADTAEQTQSVVAFDRQTGEQIWQTSVHKGNLDAKIHRKNTHASSTIATDGTHAFAVFSNNGGVWLSALTLDGALAWQKEVGKYDSKFGFGYGATPTLQDGKLFVTSESEVENFVLALNPADGEQIYRIDRKKSSSYSTPVIADVAGKRQLLLSGVKTVKGYDAETGEELWSANTNWDVSCGTMVWHEDLAFASGGYPQAQTLAVRADGSGEIAWSVPVKCYEQSMIVVDGYLYGQSDRGVIYCWEAATGKEMWKKRAEGPVSASPVLAGGNLYFTSEKGNTFVIKSNPQAFTLVAKNHLGDSTFASMTMLDNRIYTRVGVGEPGSIKEFLYCLGSE